VATIYYKKLSGCHRRNSFRLGYDEKARVVNVADVQIEINEALGVAPAANDLNGDGLVNAADVQMLINAALGLGCTAT